MNDFKLQPKNDLSLLENVREALTDSERTHLLWLIGTCILTDAAIGFILIKLLS